VVDKLLTRKETRFLLGVSLRIGTLLSSLEDLLLLLLLKRDLLPLLPHLTEVNK
jgi:hypothetical protein